MQTKKLFGAVIGVIAFMAVVAGATYAWFTWSSGNTTVGGTTGCFTINYTGGQAITGTLVPTATYDATGHKDTTVTIGIDPTCTIDGEATIKLTTNATTSAGLLASTCSVDPAGNTTPELCTEDSGTWGSALKYSVFKEGVAEAIATGTITATGEMNLATAIDLTTTDTDYTVYVWLDGNHVTNAYTEYSYSGYISASAVQVNAAA